MRKIIHCDCDCFYAAVEMRDDPSLVGAPLAVGGRAEERGVIAPCNYEARAFGVHSAMSTARALKLCPQLILLPPDFTRYREASRRILAIYRDYTPLVEPLSLDEAYLDVTGVDRCRGSATLMAQEIRARIRARLEERIATLVKEPDQNRLEQELVIIAQRLDVDEEIDRLRGHLTEVRNTFASQDAAGRRLDFLMQELNREVNTLSSKSQDLDTTRTAVEMKVLIEQMREQVQNIE